MRSASCAARRRSNRPAVRARRRIHGASQLRRPAPSRGIPHRILGAGRGQTAAHASGEALQPAHLPGCRRRLGNRPRHRFETRGRERHAHDCRSQSRRCAGDDGGLRAHRRSGVVCLLRTRPAQCRFDACGGPRHGAAVWRNRRSHQYGCRVHQPAAGRLVDAGSVAIHAGCECHGQLPAGGCGAAGVRGPGSERRNRV